MDKEFKQNLSDIFLCLLQNGFFSIVNHCPSYQNKPLCFCCSFYMTYFSECEVTSDCDGVFQICNTITQVCECDVGFVENNGICGPDVASITTISKICTHTL